MAKDIMMSILRLSKLEILSILYTKESNLKETFFWLRYYSLMC